jgi:hypothetical protein
MRIVMRAAARFFGQAQRQPSRRLADAAAILID